MIGSRPTAVGRLGGITLGLIGASWLVTGATGLLAVLALRLLDPVSPTAFPAWLTSGPFAVPRVLSVAGFVTLALGATVVRLSGGELP
jgi:hypothetical protein